MSVIFLTCFECYFCFCLLSVWLANTEHHRGKEAFQQINTSGANLRGAAVFWYLMIYSKNKTISTESRESFFSGGRRKFIFSLKHLKWKMSRGHTFQPNLKGVKHFQMAAGNYCSVCISPRFTLSPNHHSWPQKCLLFFFITLFHQGQTVQKLKGDSDACLCLQILPAVPMCNHFEGRKHH